MESLLAGIVSSVAGVIILVITVLITYAAVRGARNKYVPSSNKVLESFSIKTAAPGETVIRITGRHKGIISWVLTNLGMESRFELTVTDKEWVLREGSLAGMLVVCSPLKRIRATICGYQRSLLALFFAVYFALIAAWDLICAILVLVTVVGTNTEAGRETVATHASILFFGAFGSLVLCGIAGIIYNLSKRISFGIDVGKIYGIIFKRSFIENEAIDLNAAEQATALLNRLIAATVYDLPLAQIPSPSTPASKEPGSGVIRNWIIAATYVGLFVIAAVLIWYGNGVTVQFSTMPVGTNVWLDNQYLGATNNKAPVLVLPHVTRELHTLTAQSQGYQPFKQMVYVGGLESSQNVVVTMTLPSYPVTITTTPGNSHVAVDGKDAGISNDAGMLAIPKVDRGNHQLTVSHDGFRTVTENVGVFGPHSFSIGLVTEAVAAHQDAESRQREITAHLDRGRMLFRQGQYVEALAECDAVLKLDPSNAAAQALKKQIEQTRKILGQ